MHPLGPALHDAYASDYDRQVQLAGCYLAEVLFGLCYEFILPGQLLLDAGIGTGLSAMPFAKAGLQVYGMDFSPEMLELCREKGFAAGLKRHDLQDIPWPFPTAGFDVVVCCGVFHFLASLDVIYAEVKRLLRPRGLFAFTTKAPSASSPQARSYDPQLIDGFDIFEHHVPYLESLNRQSQFEPLKQLRCFVGSDIFYAWLIRRV